MDSRLREAAQTGSIDGLYKLIQEDPYVLEQVDRVPFVNTPLHIAAAEGHVSFAMEMMNLKPSFARKRNPEGLSPLHLALKKERSQLVDRLLTIDKELVRVKGKEGTTPFHLAARKGDTELVLQFLEACPECIQDLNVKGETALMISLRKKKLETFEALLGWLERSQHKDAQIWEESIVNHKDNEGDTLLQIAAENNLPKVAKLLLNCHLPVDVDAVNLEKVTSDFPGQTTITVSMIKLVQRDRISKRKKKSGLKSKYIGSKFSYWNRKSVAFGRALNNMSMDMVNALLVIAALIITAAYQSSLSPPGSVWQSGSNNNISISSSPTDSSLFTVRSQKVGSTVMNEIIFILYLGFNSVAIWSGIVLIKRLFPRGALLLTMPLYLLGASFQLSMCVLSPNTWILRTQYVFFLCITIFPISRVFSVLKMYFQRPKKVRDGWSLCAHGAVLDCCPGCP